MTYIAIGSISSTFEPRGGRKIFILRGSPFRINKNPHEILGGSPSRINKNPHEKRGGAFVSQATIILLTALTIRRYTLDRYLWNDLPVLLRERTNEVSLKKEVTTF